VLTRLLACRPSADSLKASMACVIRRLPKDAKTLKPRLRILAAIVATVLLGGLVLLASRPGESTMTTSHVLAAEGTLRWFKGNVHTHTLWSDGDDYPEMVALWFPCIST